MAESTLTFQYLDLKKAVAYYLGYGRDETIWTADQTLDIEEAVQNGYRMFMNPPILVEGKPAHRWRFTKIFTTLTLAEDDDDYDLPDDFGSLHVPFTYDPGESGNNIAIVNEGRIRQLGQGGEVTGAPSYAATRVKEFDGSGSTRWEAIFWPIPDGEYTLTYGYNMLLNALSDANPFPAGGAAHSATIRAACLAAAELDQNDERGPHYQDFLTNLRTSIANDLRSGQEYFGYNGDCSTDTGIRITRTQTVTYNNVQY